MRITPAGAGKTSSPVTSVNPPQDHPRRCGENSPALLRRQRLSGITPAGAGKTSYLPHSCGITADHPRRCGENYLVICEHNYELGITPAGAGKTGTARLRCVGTEDHPRRCGENADSPPNPQPCAGSPPQVRGKRLRRKAERRGAGITPAGAGKTGDRNSISLAVTDHPRRCGENTKKIL